jgi:ParB-like chromosome segregation protein Spo0J
MKKEYEEIAKQKVAAESDKFSSSSTNIKINPEYSNLVHPLSNLEYESLKNSIKKDGLHYPIIVNLKVEILDGHHRYTIAKELEIIPIKYEIKNFEDPIAEKGFVIDINLKRRQFNDFQKYELIYSLEKIDQAERYKKKVYERRFEKENFKDKDLS